MSAKPKDVDDLLVALGYPTGQLSSPTPPQPPDKPEREHVKIKRRKLAKMLLDFREE